MKRATKEEKEPDMNSELLFSFSLLEEDLAAAAALRDDHSRPLVLVFDYVDRLAKGAPNFLASLQHFAKKEAGKGNLRVVLITSNGSALPLLMSRSSWSRTKKPPLEVGEVPGEGAAG